jgi:M6 family metalloprotease-like protein
MFNDSTSGANSMYNYFKQVSYQQLFIRSTYYPAPSGSTILSYQDIYARNYYLPYSASNPSGYSTESQRRTREFALLERAINYVKSSIPSGLDIDYNQDGLVDNICFVVKGNVGSWSDLLWPHRWSLYDRTVLINGKRAYDFNFQLEGATNYFNNSVLCHEMFHTLGAPDLYHYNTDWDHLVPVGRWDIMENTANPPQHMGAYMKYVYGNWIDSIPEITRYGTYTLKSLGSRTIRENANRIATDDPPQFIFWNIEERRILSRV